MRNTYDYDDAEEGMQDAVERARAAYDTDADDHPMVLPEMDFTGAGPAARSRDFSDDPEALSLLETQQPSGGPRPRPALTDVMHAATPQELPDERAARKRAEFSEETGDQPPPPRQRQEPEEPAYVAALGKIRDFLSRPVADDSAGLAEAQQKDRDENRTNRILDYLSAGLRRAPTAQLTPAATNAAGFMDLAKLRSRRDADELSRLGRSATLSRPAAAKGAPQASGNVDALRAYLVKVGAGSEDELAGMSETQLKAAASMFGLKSRIDTHGKERSEDIDYRERSLKQREASASATRALAARGLERKDENQVADDAQKLGEKLGDNAVFEQRYARLKQLAEENGGQLPGLGAIEGVRQQPGLVGSVMRAVSPPKPAAVESRKLLRQLASDYARAISGAGVSDRERAALNAATVDVDNDDSSIAMAGLESLREMYETKAAQLKKGYRPEAVERVSGGKVQMSDGRETLMVDPSDVAAAERDGFKRVR